MTEVISFESGHEAGEPDLTYEEVQRRARSLFGRRAYIFIQRGPHPRLHGVTVQRFGIGRFVDANDTRPEIYRDWQQFGVGDSFHEALTKAERRARSSVQRPPRVRKGRGRNAAGHSVGE